jgi:hypothetical protein
VIWLEQLVCVCVCVCVCAVNERDRITCAAVCPSVAVDATLRPRHCTFLSPGRVLTSRSSVISAYELETWLDGCLANHFVLSDALVVLPACRFLTSVFKSKCVLSDLDLGRQCGQFSEF